MGKWKFYSLARPPTALHQTLLRCVGSCLGEFDDFAADRELSSRTYMELHRRIELLTGLPLASRDRMALTARLEAVGKSAESTGDED